MKVPWNVFKCFVDHHKAHVKYVDLIDRYWVKSWQGRFEVEIILKKDESNASDFESNYKLNADKTPADKVIQSLGEETFLFKGIGMKFSAEASSETTHDLLFDKAYAMKGGMFYSTNGDISDSIKVSLVDKDNVLGAGAGVVINEQIPKWYVIPGTTMHIDDIAVSYLPAAGLYLRVTYNNTQQSSVDAVLNMIVYELN